MDPIRVAPDKRREESDPRRLASAADQTEEYLRGELSPDGSTLAMVRFHGLGSIEVMSLTKTLEPGAVRKLEWAGADVRGVAWTTDGRDLVVSLPGSNPRPL